MTTSTTNRPVKTLTDGMLKAAIWRNEKDGKQFYSVTFARSYKDADGNYGDANSYSGTELLRLAKLADRAYVDIATKRNPVTYNMLISPETKG